MTPPTAVETAVPEVEVLSFGTRDESALGKSYPRVDGVAKVSGKAVYSSDFSLPHMLHGRILFSDRPHARILSVDCSRALSLPGVKAVITAADAPVVRTGIYIRDKLIFAREKVRFIGEPVAAVAAATERIAAEALELIRVEYEDLPAVTGVQEAADSQAPLIHPEVQNYASLAPYIRYGNVCMEARLSKGDVDRASAAADFVFEDTYTTRPHHQAPLAVHAAVANFEPDGRLTVWTSTQQVSLCHFEVAQALDMPMTRVCVVPLALGGGFGGRLKSGYEPVCALLSKAARAPVRLALSREEEFLATTPSPPFRITLRTGVTRDGTLVAKEAEILADVGGYADHVPGVVAHALALMEGPYRIPHCRGRARAVYTNNINYGCMRGYGVPQITFATESQMDSIAHRLGIDPVDFRQRNLCADGDVTVDAQTLHSVHVRETMEAALALSDYRAKKDRLGPHRGIGVANLMKATGFLPSSAVVRVNEDATVTIVTAVVDIGTGTHTALCQVAAEVLGIPVERVSVANSDSDTAPYDTGSIGSRTIYDSGNAVRLAAEDLRGQLIEVAARQLGCEPGAVVLDGGSAYREARPEHKIAFDALVGSALFATRGPLMGHASWLSATPRDAPLGDGFYDGPYGTFGFGTHVAEVEVDPETGRVSVLNYTAIHDVGKVINPQGIMGQVQGGVIQGIGCALFEEMILEGGRVLNPNLVDYRVPTCPDSPEVKVGFIEAPDPTGPFGAKGIGEYPILAPAAAVANAIFDATGVRVRDLPITPERLYFALQASG